MIRYFRNKVALALTLFSAALSALFCVLVFSIMRSTDDLVREGILNNYFQAVETGYARTGQFPEFGNLSGVTLLVQGQDRIPDWLAGHPQGYFERYPQGRIEDGKAIETHVLVADLEDGEQTRRIYLIYSAEGQATLDVYEPAVERFLLLIALFVTVLGSVLGMFIARRLADPAQQLAEHTRKIDPDSPVFIPLDRRDEFGEISQAFETVIDKINRVVEREKQFSRYASHELRTPVAVTKSSLSLWQACSDKPDQDTAEIKARLMERIGLANQQMEDVIQTFLLLSKQEIQWQEVEPFDPGQLLQELINKYRMLNQDKPVEVVSHLQSPASMEKNRAAVSLVFTNALRNAFDYSASRIDIRLEPASLSITNDIDQLRIDKTEHFGFGLKIIADLCAILNWRFECHKLPDSRFVIGIYFDGQSASH